MCELFMSTFCSRNQVFNFYEHLSKAPIALSLFKSKLENIGSTQKHPNLSKIFEFIKEKIFLVWKE